MALMFYIVIWECINNVFHHVDVGNFFFAPNFDSSTGTAVLLKTTSYSIKNSSFTLIFSSFTFRCFGKVAAFSQSKSHCFLSADLETEM